MVANQVLLWCDQKQPLAVSTAEYEKMLLKAQAEQQRELEEKKQKQVRVNQISHGHHLCALVYSTCGCMLGVRQQELDNDIENEVIGDLGAEVDDPEAYLDVDLRAEGVAIEEYTRIVFPTDCSGTTNAATPASR